MPSGTAGGTASADAGAEGVVATVGEERASGKGDAASDSASQTGNEHMDAASDSGGPIGSQYADAASESSGHTGNEHADAASDGGDETGSYIAGAVSDSAGPTGNQYADAPSESGGQMADKRVDAVSDGGDETGSQHADAPRESGAGTGNEHADAASDSGGQAGNDTAGSSTASAAEAGAPAPAASVPGAGSGAPEPSTAQDDCPVHYPRLTMQELAAGARSPTGQRPYLFGAPPRPNCTNCDRRDKLWSNFCQFKSHGPVCSQWLRQSILTSWVNRTYELPLTMTPCDLWRHLRGKTLLLMGDSMMLDLYKASFCFMFEFWPSLELAPLTSNASLAQRLTVKSGVAPSCVRLVHNTSICYVRMDEGQDFHGRALPVLLEHGLVTKHDLLIANFGLHHGQGGYRHLVETFVGYYKSQAARLPRLFWHRTLAQHFKTPTGEYGGGKPPFACHAIPGLQRLEGEGAIVLQPGFKDPRGLRAGGWRNQAADAVMRGAGVPIIDSFNESAPMWAAHRDNGDGHECTHYCHPAGLQVSVARFYKALRDAEAGQGAAKP